MYPIIQKRMNIVFIILFTLTAIVLYLLFSIMIQYTTWAPIGIPISFTVIIFVVHFLLSFIQKHIEIITINKMISQKHIALCQIIKGTPYKQTKDISFHKHNIYEFKIKLYTQSKEEIETTIYEDVGNSDFSLLPTYAYVTYNGNSNMIGFIPTFVLFMNPSLKDIVKEYEKTYKPTYSEISKKKGLSIQSFTNQYS